MTNRALSQPPKVKTVHLHPDKPFVISGVDSSSYIFHGSGLIHGGGTMMINPDHKMPSFLILGDHITVENINFQFMKPALQSHRKKQQDPIPCISTFGSYTTVKNSQFHGCRVGILSRGKATHIEGNRFDSYIPQQMPSS